MSILQVLVLVTLTSILTTIMLDCPLSERISNGLILILIVAVARCVLYTVLLFEDDFFRKIQKKHMEYLLGTDETHYGFICSFIDIRTLMGIDINFHIRAADIIKTFLLCAMLASVAMFITNDADIISAYYIDNF